MGPYLTLVWTVLLIGVLVWVGVGVAEWRMRWLVVWQGRVFKIVCRVVEGS